MCEMLLQQGLEDAAQGHHHGTLCLLIGLSYYVVLRQRYKEVSEMLLQQGLEDVAQGIISEQIAYLLAYLAMFVVNRLFGISHYVCCYRTKK